MLWRITAAAGGVAGLASLVFPYAMVTGGTLGVELHRGRYTLVELASLLREAGRDPTGVYVVALLVVVGSAVAIGGALTRGGLAVGGGLVQGVASVAFTYGILTAGSGSFLLGLGRTDAQLEVGVFVLAAATLVTLSTGLVLGLEVAVDRLRS